MSSFVAKAALPFALAVALAGCSSSMSEPEPVEVSDQVRLSAIVQTVDMQTRQVLLRGEDGTVETITAGPEVRNLDQLQAGDRVVAVYERGVAAQMAPADAEPGIASATGVAVPSEGQRPGMVAADETVAIVTFISYDPATQIARIEDGDGFVHSVVVEKPELQTFASGLREGDRVEVVFTEALAIGVEEVSG
jgi:hypothetical protein